MSKLTWEDYEIYPHIKLTSPNPWSPSSYEYAAKGENLVACVRTLKEQAKIDDQVIFETDNLDHHINLI